VVIIAVAVVAIAGSAAYVLMTPAVKKPIRMYHVWGGAEEEPWHKVLTAFETKSGIVVDDVIKGSEWREAILTEIAAGNPCDVAVSWSGTFITDLAKKGQVLDITDDVGPLVKNFPGGTVDGVTLNGRLYAAPTKFSAWVVGYNKKVFEKLGISVPTNLDEFEAVCEKIKAAGIIPLASTLRDGAQFHIDHLIMSLYGPEFYAKLWQRHEVSWASPEVKTVFEKVAEWGKKGYFGPEPLGPERTVQVSFLATGEKAMFVDGNWLNVMLQAAGAKPDEDFGFFVFPGAADRKAGLILLVDWAFAPKACANPEGAKEFLKFVVSKDAQTTMKDLGLASNPDVSIDTYTGLDRWTVEALRAYPSAVFGPALAPEEFSEAMIRKSQELFTKPDQWESIANSIEEDALRIYGK